MPTSQDPAIFLRQQFHHLLRDWDDYKTSIPLHRRLHSADLYFTPDADSGHLRSPLEKPVSPLHRPHPGRRLLDSFEKAKEATAAEAESKSESESESESSPPRSPSSCSSSTSSITMTSSSYYEENGLGGAKRETRSSDRWFVMLRWFAIVMAGAAVVVFSLRTVLVAEEVPQFMIPT